jgi:hypothetical protein
VEPIRNPDKIKQKKKYGGIVSSILLNFGGRTHDDSR